MSELANDPIEVLVSADAHVGETDECWKRIPEPLRRYQSTGEFRPDGAILLQIEGVEVELGVRDGIKAVDFEKEFRRDPSRGTDLDVRRSHMAREGVDAQVIFPNEGLGMGVGDVPTEFRIAWARAYNDYVYEIFWNDPKRFKPAAMLPIDDIDATLAEAERCVERGFHGSLRAAQQCRGVPGAVSFEHSQKDHLALPRGQFHERVRYGAP